MILWHGYDQEIGFDTIGNLENIYNDESNYIEVIGYPSTLKEAEMLMMQYNKERGLQTYYSIANYHLNPNDNKQVDISFDYGSWSKFFRLTGNRSEINVNENK